MWHDYYIVILVMHIFLLFLLNFYYVYGFYTVANYRNLLFNVKASFY